MPYYDHDKDYPFAAFITNLGKYNEGELVGEWVKFPTTAEELKEVFKRIGIGQKDDFGQPYEEWFITDYDCYVDGLYSKLGEYENLDELNYLASKLDEMDQSDYAKFQAAMEIGDYTSSLQEIINLTENLDCYEIYPNIEDYDDLGRYYIEELEVTQVPAHLQNYIDYEAYGRDVALEENGTFTDQGLDFVLCSSVEGTFEACSSAGNKITEGGVIGKVSEEEIKSPVDATILSIISSNESVPKNYPLATAKYTGFALNIEAENFLKILPENAALKAKFQVVDGVGPTEAIAVVVPVSENAESTLQCLIGKDIDVKPGQSATVVITAETRKDVLLLPLSVIAGRQGKGMVTVINDGKQIQTEVMLGATDGAYIEILSGVNEGDTISSIPPNLDPRSKE